MSIHKLYTYIHICIISQKNNPNIAHLQASTQTPKSKKKQQSIHVIIDGLKKTHII